MALTLKVFQTDPEFPFRPPVRQHLGDCGFDLYVARTYSIGPGLSEDISHNLQIELPLNTWGLLVGRSSSFRTKGLHVVTGILDNGYRGPVNAMVLNLTQEQVTIQAGDRVAQLIVMPLVSPEIELVTDLNMMGDSDRGQLGYGSTGK